MFVQEERKSPIMAKERCSYQTLDWSSIRNMTFQVIDITKALGSVSKMLQIETKEFSMGQEVS